jgi:hypothetical protein
MFKRKIYLSFNHVVFILLIISSPIKSYCQEGNKVIHYGKLTPEQIQHQKIQKEITSTSTKISEIYKKYNINHPGTVGFGTTDKNIIQRIVNENKNLLGRINSSGIKALETKLQSLQTDVGLKWKETEISSIEKAAHKNIKNGELRISELNGNEIKNKLEDEKHIRNVDSLNSKIRDLDAVISGKTKKLEEINNKSKTLDDFLKTRKVSVSKSDFLSNNKANSNKNSEDFLVNKNSGSGDLFSKKTTNKSDFLDSSQASSLKGKIISKNGKTGVIDSKGNILIPFKDWRISAFKNGVAEVYYLLDSYSCENRCVGSYSAWVHKSGFVDSTGNFLDGIQITSGDNWQSLSCLTLSRGNDTRTSEQIRRDKEYEIRKNKKFKSDCINEGKQWQLTTINKYK